MSATVQVRQGVRYGRFKTAGGRWGPGKIHLRIWRKEHKQWVCACDFNNVGAFSGYYGEPVDLSNDVTCKKCLKAMP